MSWELWLILIGVVLVWGGLGEAVKAQQPTKKNSPPQVVNLPSNRNKILEDEIPLTLDTYMRLKARSEPTTVRFR